MTAASFSSSGKYIKALPVREGERFFDVAVDSTLRAALLRHSRAEDTNAFSVSPCDLHKKRFKRPGRNLIVFVVDASDSMGEGTFARMKAAKGAALAILSKARLGRHRIAVVAFRGESADVLLQPTASIALARQRLKSLPTGGATPLAAGLIKAWKLVKAERLKDPHINPLLVVISDGEANVSYVPDRKLRDVADEVALIAQRIAKDGIDAIVIDTKPFWEKSGGMLRLARSLGGAYHHLTRIHARHVVEFISRF